MIFNLEINEIEQILLNGTTNQQTFIKNVINHNLDLEQVLNISNEFLKMFDSPDDIRGAINGGALYLEDDEIILNDNAPYLVFEKLENNLYLIFEFALY